MLMSIGFVLVAVLGSYLFNEIRRVKNELARIRAGHLLHLLKKGVIGEVWSGLFCSRSCERTLIQFRRAGRTW